MLHHLTLWVPDLERAEPSWSWLLCDRLGYSVERGPDRLLRFRAPDGFILVLEESADMVPGMLHSRLRPGLNHLAFTVDSLDDTLAGAADHGWTRIAVEGHRIAGGAEVIYLEDRDGFEVELVCTR